MHATIFCSVQGRPGLPFGGLDVRACPCPSSSPYKQGFRGLGGRINRRRRHQPQKDSRGESKNEKENWELRIREHCQAERKTEQGFWG